MSAKPGVAQSVRLFGYTMPLPRSRALRIVIGVLLVIGGVFSFLPVLGVWMLPLGLIVLSIDIPRVRRWRRRLAVWFHRRYPRLAAKLSPADAKPAADPAKPARIDTARSPLILSPTDGSPTE